MIVYVSNVETHWHIIGYLVVAMQCIVCGPRFDGDNTCDIVDDETKQWHVCLGPAFHYIVI